MNTKKGHPFVAWVAGPLLACAISSEVYAQSAKLFAATKGKVIFLVLLVTALAGCPPPTPPEATPLLCYEADHGDQIALSVNLSTQFGEEQNVALGRLMWLCEPVHKAHDSLDLPNEPPDFLPLGCYEISGNVVGLQVQLSDQNNFYNGSADVEGPIMFCDPVQMKQRQGQPPSDGDPFPTPLKGYGLTNVPPVTGTIFVRDQFGAQAITFEETSHLLEPATKNDPGAPLPDHLPLHCYKVATGDPANESVKIRNQFSEYELEIIVPLYFCDPTEKN